MKMIRKNDACKKLGISRATLYRIINRDPTFPSPHKISNSISVFCEHDINEWVESRNERLLGELRDE
jgi:predicted DNA-binding transcriptional regulator AlpA